MVVLSVNRDISDWLILSENDSSFDFSFCQRSLDLCIIHTLLFTLWFLILLSGLLLPLKRNCLNMFYQLSVLGDKHHRVFTWQAGKEIPEAMSFQLCQENPFTFLCAPGISKRRNQLLSNFPKNQFSSVAQSYLTHCDPMDCNTPGFPVHQQLLELAQTHVHRVSDAIQPSHPLSSPSPPAFSLSQHPGLFQWVSFFHQVARVLELRHQSFQWIFRPDFL